MKNKQKGFIIPFLLVIIALIVIGGGVYIYNKNSVETPDKSSKTYTNTQYKFSFNYPSVFTISNQNIGQEGLVLLRDSSKTFPNTDLHNQILVSAFSAKGATSFADYLTKYPIVDANSNRPLNFVQRTLGSNIFYYAQTERFEGTLSYSYYLLKGDTIFDFTSISHGVAWTDPNLDVENDSTHSFLKGLLTSLRFTH